MLDNSSSIEGKIEILILLVKRTKNFKYFTAQISQKIYIKDYVFEI